MLTKGIVPYLRGVGPLFAFMLAVLSTAPLNSATSTYGLPDTANPNASTAVVDRFLAQSLSDHGSEATGAASIVDDTNAQAGMQSLAYAPDVQDRSDEFINVAWNRGLRKFLLFALICGALIRYFTSPGFLSFITDALDPKSW